jgi:hypothetical protein
MPTPHTRRTDRQPATDGVLRTQVPPNPIAGPMPSALQSFYADRNAEGWEAGEPVRADGRARSVTKAIKQFLPKDVPDEKWTRIEGLVRESATKAAPCGCRKPHPAHRPGTMCQKERRHLSSDLRPASVAAAVRQDPDGELEILVSNPIGVFGTHNVLKCD